MTNHKITSVPLNFSHCADRDLTSQTTVTTPEYNPNFLDFMHGSDLLTQDDVDYCAEKNPWIALRYCLNRLTPQQFDYCIRREPEDALMYGQDRLTPEQFDYCVRKAPETALILCLDKLTPEQREYCQQKMLNDQP